MNLYGTSGAGIMIGDGTLAELDQHLAGKVALGGIERVVLATSTFEVKNDATLVDGKSANGIWMITSTSRVKISNDVQEASTFKAKAGADEVTIASGQTLSFAATDVSKVTLDTATNTVSVGSASTIADAGKVTRVNNQGVTIFGRESVVGATPTQTVTTTITEFGFINADVIADGAKAVENSAAGVGVKKSIDSLNDFTFGTDGGAFSKKYTIKSGYSAQRAAIDANNVIEFLPTDDEGQMFETALTSIADYAGSAESIANKHGKSDKVYFVNAIGKREGWIARVANPTTSADFMQVTGADTTDAVIRSAINGKLGVAFDKVTGFATMNRRDVTLTKPNAIELEGDQAFVDVYAQIFSTTNTSLTKTLGDMLGDINIAKNRIYTNALTRRVDTATGEQTVVQGGDFTEPTAFDAKTFDVNHNSTSTGKYRYQNGVLVIDGGMWVKNSQSVFGLMKTSSSFNWYRDVTSVESATPPLPNL